MPLMVALPVVWFRVWYIAWFDRGDCLGALRQIGPADPALFRSTQAECDAARTFRQSVETYGLGFLVLTELTIWHLTRIKSPRG